LIQKCAEASQQRARCCVGHASQHRESAGSAQVNLTSSVSRETL
jgi:hypothetical protein